MALGNLSARDFISRGIEGATKGDTPRQPSQPQRPDDDKALATLGNLSAREFIARGLESSAAGPADRELQLGQLSARAFIAAGLQKHSDARET